MRETIHYRTVSCWLTAVALLGSSVSAFGQTQDQNQQKCINALNKDGAKVAATQGKENTSCIKSAGRGQESDAQGCLTRDSKGKVGRAAGKVQADFSKNCTAETPDFGVPGVATGTAAAVTAAAIDKEVALVEEIFGTPLDDAIDTSKDGASCQSAVSKDYAKIAATAGKAFLKCKKSALKTGAANATPLQSCVQSLPADAKVAKAASKLATDVGKKCGGVNLGAAFPGACAGSSDFPGCVRERVMCRVCRMLNEMDNLATDCDSLDDGVANDSCGDSVVVPPPNNADTEVNVTPIACSVSAASLQASTAPHQYTESDNGVTRSITANGIPDHDVGVFPNANNPNTISAQSYSYMMRVTPAGAGENISKIFAIALSGVVFDPFTGEFWNDNPNWRYEALRYATAADYFQSNGGDDSTFHPSDLGVDCNYAHVQPGGSYHYHGIPEEMLPATAALTFLGWAGDGYPIFGRWGYADAGNAASGLESMTSSWRIKSGSRPANAPAGEYDGTFVADWQYVAGSGDLDECNGRSGVVTIRGSQVTTYHYYVTDSYPYIPRCFHAQPDNSFDSMMGPP